MVGRREMGGGKEGDGWWEGGRWVVGFDCGAFSVVEQQVCIMWSEEPGTMLLAEGTNADGAAKRSQSSWL